MLCCAELLETFFESLLFETDDVGGLTTEELETCVSPVLFVLGLVDESSPQAVKRHAAAIQLINKCFILLIPCLDNITNCINDAL